MTALQWWTSKGEEPWPIGNINSCALRETAPSGRAGTRALPARQQSRQTHSRNRGRHRTIEIRAVRFRVPSRRAPQSPLGIEVAEGRGVRKGISVGRQSVVFSFSWFSFVGVYSGDDVGKTSFASSRRSPGAAGWLQKWPRCGILGSETALVAGSKRRAWCLHLLCLDKGNMGRARAKSCDNSERDSLPDWAGIHAPPSIT